MPFGHQARTVRAYSYGCGRPTEPTTAIAIMRQRNDLWNGLVEVEQRARKAKDDLISREMGVDVAVDARKKVLARANVREQLRIIDQGAQTEARNLAREAPLHWMNVDDVLLSWNQARRRRDTPRFHRWTGEGKITVRWQNGLPVAKIAGTDTRLQMDPVDPTAWNDARESVRRKGLYRTMRVRIDSERRAPVWLEIPIYLHRPMPTEGIVRSVSILRERTGTHDHWRAVFVVELPEATAALAEEPAHPANAVSVDLGWRQVDEGLRVGVWKGSDGASGEVVLPTEWLDAMRKVEDISSIRDQRFNQEKAALAAWLGAIKAPEWLREESHSIQQWRSAGRLAALVLRWREHRFKDDELIYGALEEWRKRDRHLLEWEANLRDQLLHRRQWIYRQEAATLARRYNQVIVEDFDLSQAARVKKNGTGGDLPRAARYQRVLVACHSLRQALVNAFVREHGKEAVVAVDARNTTQVCHACGTLERFDVAQKLRHRCSRCGAEWDQDENAALNLLAAV